MNCDLCDNPAVVHEVTVKCGVKKEVHLCMDHAREAGIAMPNPPINQVLTKFVINSPGTKKLKAVKKACPNCDLSFARFRQKGVVGCPVCYEVFEKHLAPLIERAQNGGTHHLGKAPLRSGASIDRQLKMQQLLRELDDAVAAEEYERAATLRDRLTVLKEKSSEAHRERDAAEPSGREAD